MSFNGKIFLKKKKKSPKVISNASTTTLGMGFQAHDTHSIKLGFT